MFLITFYIFSFSLAYSDYKTFRAANSVIITMFVMLLFVGVMENKIYLSSFVLVFIVLLFFIVLLLLKPKMILGGADIKYMMLVAFFLPYTLFPLFLIITGVLQSLALLYVQNIRKRKILPMIPIMFLSVILSQIVEYYDLYTL